MSLKGVEHDGGHSYAYMDYVTSRVLQGANKSEIQYILSGIARKLRSGEISVRM